MTILPETEFQGLHLDYTYFYGGKKYGFFRKDLLEALREHSNVFLIVRSAELIRDLSKEFRFINVVPIYIYTDLDKIEERLKKQHFTREQIDFRISRHKMAFDDYLRHPALYQEVLINNGSMQDYHRLIDLMLEKYAAMSDVDEKLIFLLTSFSRDNPLLPDVAGATKRAVRGFYPGLQCINLDDVRKGSYEISAEAKSQIRRCRLAIVDLTGNRPNVYYELGFAHGISKSCILTCHRDTQPHFYPSGHRILFYANTTELEQLMIQELEGILQKRSLQVHAHRRSDARG